MLYTRIRDLSRQKKYSINRLEKDLGFARGSMCKWNTVKPSYEKILLVAEKLDVSVEELLNME